MKQKDVKALIAPLASVIALSIGAYVGLDDVTDLENALVGIGTGLLAVLAVFGVWRNNDKGDK